MLGGGGGGCCDFRQVDGWSLCQSIHVSSDKLGIKTSKLLSNSTNLCSPVRPLFFHLQGRNKQRRRGLGVLTNLSLPLLDQLSLLLDPQVIEIVSVSVELESILSIISIWGKFG